MEQLLADLVLQLGKAAAVIQHRVLAVGGAGAYDQHHLVAFAGENVGDDRVTIFLYFSKLLSEGILLLDLHGNRQLAFEYHVFHFIQTFRMEKTEYTLTL